MLCLISTIQQNDSAIAYTFFSIMLYRRILNIVPCAILVLLTRASCCPLDG